jgi:hypothetical protein
MRPVSLCILALAGIGLLVPMPSTSRTFVHAITAPWISNSVIECVLGFGFTYIYEEFERRMGSRKFVSYVCVIWAISSAIQSVVGIAVRNGLYPVVFGFLPFYIADVPAQIAYIVCGVNISTKWFVYLLAVQMMFCANPNSMVTALCAFIAGVLVKARFLPLRNIRIPKFIYNAIAKVIGKLFPFSFSGTSGNSVRQQMSFGNTQRGQEVRRNVVVPDPEMVSSLVSLGFGATDARNALIRTNNNLEQASNILLDMLQKDK